MAWIREQAWVVAGPWDSGRAAGDPGYGPASDDPPGHGPAGGGSPGPTRGRGDAATGRAGARGEARDGGPADARPARDGHGDGDGAAASGGQADEGYGDGDGVPAAGEPRAAQAVHQPGQARAAQDPAPPPTWPSRFAQALAETLAGSRPARQMAPWTTEHARSTIQRLGPKLAAGQQPRVRRVMTSRPATGVMEMTVVVGFGTRVRALAVRLELSDPHPATAGESAPRARWLCTAVEAA